MERITLLQKNVDVCHARGKQVGSLLRAGLRPEISVITDNVIQGGGLVDKVYRVVPVERVACRRA